MKKVSSMLRINRPKTHTADIGQRREDQEHNEWEVGSTELKTVVITILYYAFPKPKVSKLNHFILSAEILSKGALDALRLEPHYLMKP